jgi:hypothetical protein
LSTPLIAPIHHEAYPRPFSERVGPHPHDLRGRKHQPKILVEIGENDTMTQWPSTEHDHPRRGDDPAIRLRFPIGTGGKKRAEHSHTDASDGVHR